MTVRSADERLADIREAAGAAAAIVDRGRQVYDADFLLRLAAEAIVGRVGDAARMLRQEHPDVVRAMPEVDWQGLIDARVIVDHVYHRVDHGLLWDAMVDELPALMRTIDRHRQQGGS